jgi:uracil-DNA glycosylase
MNNVALLNYALQSCDVIHNALEIVDPSWLAIVVEGINAVYTYDPDYFLSLVKSDFFPSEGRIFAAFSAPIKQIKYVLVGEGPYPRAESATGFCFMDGAVNELWSKELAGGLSKKVNRATSLRNFIKMLLVAEGLLNENYTTSPAIAEVSVTLNKNGSGFIQNLQELQNNLTSEGFLLLNASLVFRPEISPSIDARAWRPFIEVIFSALHQYTYDCGRVPISLVLWGKIAEQLKHVSGAEFFQHIESEHPYNLTFISNKVMQNFFSPMNLLRRKCL